MDNLKISAKQLGNLVKENFCPRCFYIGYKIQFRYPWTVFAGILSKMDSLQKKSVTKYYEKNGHLPAWLEAEGIIGKPLKSPGPKKFRTEVAGVTLSGSIDLLLEKPNGELIIIDFKTASPKNGSDPFMPVYDIQLQGYAKIAEELGLGKVTELYLVYFEAETQIDEEIICGYVEEETLDVPFKVTVKKLALKTEEHLLNLIEQFKTIVTAETLPEAQPGCPDCQKINHILNLIGPVKAELQEKPVDLTLEKRGLMVEN